MKKLLPFLLLSVIFFFPQSASAGTLTEGCFPVVWCPAGQDAYGGNCQAELDSVSGAAPSCVSVNGAAPPNQYWAFSCDAGCYLKSSGGGSVNPCPGGITVNGQCLIKLNVLDDMIDAFTVGNGAYKIWDGTALTELVHLPNAGCTNDQIAVSDSTSPTGWKCENRPAYLRDVIDGIIDFAETIMTELGDPVANVTAIVTALTNLANGGTPAQITQYQSDLAAALAAFSINLPGNGYYVGSTSSAYNGSRGGYGSADSLCDASFAGSNICSATDMINSYNNDPAGPIASMSGSAWVNNGPPSYIVNVTNDCSGWKTSVSTIFGYVWDGTADASFVTPCNLTRKFACCK